MDRVVHRLRIELCRRAGRHDKGAAVDVELAIRQTEGVTGKEGTRLVVPQADVVTGMAGGVEHAQAALAETHFEPIGVQAMAGEFIQRTAAAGTRGGKAAAGAAVFTGANVAEGVRRGMQPKRICRVRRRTRHRMSRSAEPAGRRCRAEALSTAVSHAVRRAKLNRDRAERLRPQATAMGELLAAASSQGKQDGVDYANYARSLAYELTDRADDFLQGRRSSTYAIDGLANDLYGLLGGKATSAEYF